jgi:hypothetical protein
MKNSIKAQMGGYLQEQLEEIAYSNAVLASLQEDDLSEKDRRMAANSLAQASHALEDAVNLFMHKSVSISK